MAKTKKGDAGHVAVWMLLNGETGRVSSGLINPQIPKTTNGIEGFFSHLKNHLDLHRGLLVKNRINFIKWYIYLSNEK